MSDICFLKTKTHWSYKSFIFWWFTSKVLTHKCNFINSSFPTFSLSFTWSDNFKHFSLSHRFYFLYGYGPFTCFLFSFLLNHVGENFRIFLLLSVHKISRYSTFLYIFDSAFRIFLLMLFDSFFHLNFLFESFFVKYFSF